MPSRIGHLYRELSRRHVFRVAVVYAAVVFVVFQAADLIFSGLSVPDWAFTIVVVLGILGAPIAMVLAWAYDLTPHGVVRTPDVDESESSAGTTDARSGPARAPAPVPEMHSAAAALPRTAVAVLPFSNLSGDPESDYFSDGITGDVITGLCKVPGLKVISRTSVMQYRNSTRSVREIARELGVGSVLEGSVRRAGDRVRVTAQLVDASTDAHLWADAYDRRVEDVFAIQSDVALQIAQALEATLTEADHERLGRAPTRSVQAYDLYLRGRHLWNRRTIDDVRRSIGYFERALAADTAFALAAAGLADAYVVLGIYGAEAPELAMRRARDAADRALQIEPTMAEALTARACVRALYDWDWKAAEREFRHVTRIAPLYGTAHHWLAVHCLTPLGRFEEAQEQLRIACELDPLSPSVRASRGIVHYFAGRPSDAIPEYRTVLETHPDFALAHYFLGQALDALGHAREAVAEIQEAARLGARPPEVVAALGHALAASGDRAGAEAALAELEARASSAYVSPVLVAQVLVGLGERERALEALAHARSIRAADLIWLGVRPVFVPLRGEPDFDALLEAIGLTQARSAATAR